MGMQAQVFKEGDVARPSSAANSNTVAARPNSGRRDAALIPIRVQDETNSLVFRVAGFVARSLQIAADMRLARASPAARNPARLSLILNANWNKQHAIEKPAILLD